MLKNLAQTDGSKMGGCSMEESRSSDFILVIMKNLNMLIIMYISIIMAYSLSGYIQESSASEFLTKIGRMPITAWKIPVVSGGLYISCILVMFVRNVNGCLLAVKVCFEIGVSFFISYILGFSYNGILLLILADTMRYIPKPERKFPFVILVCVFYILSDYNLMSAYNEIISLDTYMEYFQNDVRSILLGIKNTVSSINTFIFLIYTILLVHFQFNEKERILSLNNQLNIKNDELCNANIQLEKYAKESEKMAETKERNRLAREIHDTLGHALAGITTGIEACIALMDVAPEATKEQLKAISDVARQGMTDVRRSVKALRPEVLEKFDLEKGLISIVNEMRIATSAEIEYNCTARLNCFNEDEEDIIYRIVQESITNSIRHGQAKRIQINISREYNLLKIYIKDNGIGCKNIEKGFGLHHMEERLAMLQGSLCYNGKDGFTIEAQIPIRWGREEENND